MSNKLRPKKKKQKKEISYQFDEFMRWMTKKMESEGDSRDILDMPEKDISKLMDEFFAR